MTRKVLEVRCNLASLEGVNGFKTKRGAIEHLKGLKTKSHFCSESMLEALVVEE